MSIFENDVEELKAKCLMIVVNHYQTTYDVWFCGITAQKARMRAVKAIEDGNCRKSELHEILYDGDLEVII